MISRRDFLKAALGTVITAAAAPAALLQADQKQWYRHNKFASASTAPVGIQLALAMDVSASMTAEEYAIEMQTTAEALNSQVFRNIIKYKSGDRSVAIALLNFAFIAMTRVYWADIRGPDINDKPYQPGKKITSRWPDKLDALSQEIKDLPRIFDGGTTIKAGMDLSRDLFINCPWDVTERRVLDIFGDGSVSYRDMPKWEVDEAREIMRPFIAASRQELAEIGVTVNGFAIVNEEPDLDEYFRTDVVTHEYVGKPGGLYSQPGRVWAVARNLQARGNKDETLKAFFGEVAKGMKQKLSVETAGLEEYYRTLARLGEAPDFPLPGAA